MADDVSIRVRLQDQARASAGMRDLAGDVRDVGDAAGATRREADRMGRSVSAAGRNVDSAASSSGKLRSALASVRTPLVGVAAAGAGLLGVGSAIGFIGEEFTESAKVGAQTAAVIKSTGGVAGITRSEVEGLAGAISLKTGIDDEAIQTGSNLLLTFKKVRNEVGKGNDVFDRATAAAVDLSAAGFGSLESTSKQLGKALNDPVKGMTALGRSGVTFTAQQKKTIEGMVEQGNLLGAQKLLLREVESQVKGSAEAQAQPMDKLRTSVGNLAETMGGMLAPAANTVVTAVTGMATKASGGLSRLQKAFEMGGVNGLIEGFDGMVGAGGRLDGALDDVRSALGSVVGVAKNGAAAFKPLLPAVSALPSPLGLVAGAFLLLEAGGQPLAIALGSVVAGFIAFRTVMFVQGLITGVTVAMGALNAVMIANPVGVVVAGLVALGLALYLAHQKSETFREGVQSVWSFLKDNWPLLTGILTAGLVPAIVLIVRNWDKLKGTASDVVGFVKEKFSSFVDFFKSVPGKLSGAFSGMFDGIKDAFRSAINFIISGWNSLDFKIPGFDPPGPGPKFGGVTIGVPDIPMLAKGGTVRGMGSWVTGEDGAELNTMLPGGGVRVQPLGGSVRSPVLQPAGAPEDRSSPGSSASLMQEVTDRLVDALLRHPTIVQVDRRELGRAVRDDGDQRDARRFG